MQVLGVPVPEGVPFPHLNDADEFKRRIRKMQVMQTAMLGGVGALLILVLRRLLRR